MDVLPTRDSFFTSSRKAKKKWADHHCVLARMLMQDFLNNTFETSKFNSMDLEIWYYKSSGVSVICTKRSATYFCIAKIKIPSTKDN